MVLKPRLPYLIVTLAILFACCVALNAQVLVPGTVSGVSPYNNPSGLGVCPSDFWSPPSPNTASYCYSATMTCSAYSSTVPTLTFIYSYATPGSPGTAIVAHVQQQCKHPSP
jgi:hypothetical protein